MVHLINFIGNHGKDDKPGFEAQLSSLFKRWVALGVDGVDGVADDVPKILKSRRKKGNVKGEAVITLDPI